MTDRTLTGLVSIHDVMPETLDVCQTLIDRLRASKVEPITLLVVPGKDWREKGLAQLRDWQQEGLVLAGHGWTHQVSHCHGLYHKLHSLFLSRLAAEHLSLREEQIAALIQQCHDWFQRQGLKPPTLYVPPAWALGKLPWSRLKALPFTQVELLAGVLHTNQQQFRRLPLTGYEADTAWRASSLGLWNRFNVWRARNSGLPLRIGIHPFDARLRLNEQMQAQIDACDRFCSYAELFSA
jgi:hypothetical protein